MTTARCHVCGRFAANEGNPPVCHYHVPREPEWDRLAATFSWMARSAYPQDARMTQQLAETIARAGR